MESYLCLSMVTMQSRFVPNYLKNERELKGPFCFLGYQIQFGEKKMLKNLNIKFRKDVYNYPWLWQPLLFLLAEGMGDKLHLLKQHWIWNSNEFASFIIAPAFISYYFLLDNMSFADSHSFWVFISDIVKLMALIYNGWSWFSVNNYWVSRHSARFQVKFSLIQNLRIFVYLDAHMKLWIFR